MDGLTDWRKTNQLTAKQAADLIGVSRTQLFRLESGMRRPSASRAKQIEAVTGIHRSRLRPDIFESPATQG